MLALKRYLSENIAEGKYADNYKGGVCKMKKIAVITGGATGIGKAAAKKLAKEGYSPVLIYNSSKAPAEAVKAEIEAEGAECRLYQADVSKEDECKRVFNEIGADCGRIDTFVNCAGVTKYIRFSDLDSVTADVWDKLLGVNLIGAFNCCREASKQMKKNGGGSIVIVASLAGVRASGSSIPYDASKAAIIHTAKCLAMALAPDIRVNTVSPGIVTDTAWHRDDPSYNKEAADAREAAFIPLGYVTKPDEVADSIVFLATDRSSNITGIDLVIDGGRKEVHHGQVY